MKVDISVGLNYSYMEIGDKVGNDWKLARIDSTTEVELRVVVLSSKEVTEQLNCEENPVIGNF